jgi:TetR/AcrR family transcriptional regulator
MGQQHREVYGLAEKSESELSRRERRKLQLREEVLDVALDLFTEKGFHDVAMQEVADRVEVSVGTLYNIFSSKEDLYQQLVVEHARDFIVSLRKRLSEGGGNALEIIRNHVAAAWGVLSSDRRLLKLYLGLTQGARFSLQLRLDPNLKREADLLTTDLAAVMDRAVSQKVFRPVGGRNLALMLQGISHSFFVNWLQNPIPEEVDRNVMMILDLFLRGALAEPAPDGGEVKHSMAG